MLVSLLWSHSSWTTGCRCLGKLLKEHFFPHKYARRTSGCDDIRNKEWYISFVLSWSLVCSATYSFLQVFFFLFCAGKFKLCISPLSEMHKQAWHLPLSKQRLMLHYSQSVNLLNVCLSMMDDMSRTLKGDCFLNLKSCIFRDSRRDAPDSRPPTPCCLTLTRGRIWLLLSGQRVFSLERHIWPWIISP